MHKRLLFMGVALTIAMLGASPALWADLYNVTDESSNPATPGSLPWCVYMANNVTPNQPDIINFTISNSITVHATLSISDQVDIRGNSNSVGAHDGTGANPQNCFHFAAGSSGSTITGLALVDSNAGVSMLSGRNRVMNCRLGVDWAGTPHANTWGVYDTGQDNQIGGGPGEGNVVSNNSSVGIYLINSQRSRVQGNYIGTNIAGTAALGTQQVGVYLVGAVESLVGGDRSSGLGNLISGNTVYGVLLENDVTFGNTLCGNVIGLSSDETSAVPNQVDGIRLQEASGNTIGLPLAGYENVVAGNLQNNIILYQGSSTPTRVQHTIIQNNFIGVNSSSAEGFVSNAYSLYLNGADLNLIGGDRNTLERNVVSGNTLGGYGLYVIGNNNSICGNYIGTNDGGTAGRHNLVGVVVAGDSNLIGGANQGGVIKGNVVSGNWSSGIIINSGDSNTLAGNYIGLTGNGASALANLNRGVLVSGGAARTLIGGWSPAERNVIANNANEGVYCLNGFGHQVIGNYIGMNATGTATMPDGNNTSVVFNGIYYGLIHGNDLARAIGVWNTGAFGNTITANRIGIRPDGATTSATVGVNFALGSHGNFCGRPAAQGNLITGALQGVRVDGTATIGNAIQGNTITACSTAAISLTDNGNGNKTAPVITSANSSGNITGTALMGDYVEVFVAEGASGNGGSVRYVGAATADGSGNWSVLAGGQVSTGQYVCALATDSANNTSAFSTNVLVIGPSPTPTATQTLTPIPTPTITVTPTVTGTPTATATNALAGIELGGRALLAYPNPARSQMIFVFHLEQTATVKIAIYNLAGEQAAELSSDLAAGRGQSLVWDCRSAAPGVYLARFMVNGAEKAKLKVAVTK